jgi:hypothetical protein
MGKRLLVGVTLFLIAGVALMSCGRPSGPVQEGTLAFSGPAEIGVAAGQLVPGTGMGYVEKVGDTAKVRIGEERAFKRPGDSLNWAGSPLRGTDLEVKQRVLWFNDETLQLAGTVRLDVHNADPQPGPIPSQPEEPDPRLVVYRLPVLYRVQTGDNIPGTTLAYEGQGEEGARLGGLAEGEYPYREVGDSIAWQGQLRSGVFLDLLVRTTLFDDSGLTVAGFATVMLQTET